MTHYDKLIDCIKIHLNSYYVSGLTYSGWDEKEAAESARSILEAVEEFQDKRNLNQWRATD